MTATATMSMVVAAEQADDVAAELAAHGFACEYLPRIGCVRLLVEVGTPEELCWLEALVAQLRAKEAPSCPSCEHRQWEEGDHAETPPGLGIYFCDLMPFPGGGLAEAEAKGTEAPAWCRLRRTPRG